MSTITLLQDRYHRWCLLPLPLLPLLLYVQCSSATTLRGWLDVLHQSIPVCMSTHRSDASRLTLSKKSSLSGLRACTVRLSSSSSSSCALRLLSFSLDLVILSLVSPHLSFALSACIVVSHGRRGGQASSPVWAKVFLVSRRLGRTLSSAVSAGAVLGRETGNTSTDRQRERRRVCV